MTKVSNEIRLHIARESKSDVWKLDVLMNVIRDEVEACEASEGSKVSQVKCLIIINRSWGIICSANASTLVSNEFHIIVMVPITQPLVVRSVQPRIGVRYC